MPHDTSIANQSAGMPSLTLSNEWRAALTLLMAGVFGLIAITSREWGEMLHQWWNIDTYTHILLVPLIIAWLVRLKAEELAKIAPQSFAPGLVLLAAALTLWVLGRTTGINLFAHAGAVGALQALVVTVLGLRASLLKDDTGANVGELVLVVVVASAASGTAIVPVEPSTGAASILSSVGVGVADPSIAGLGVGICS